MRSKKYKNAVILDNVKDATLVAGMEGYGNVNYNTESYFPCTLVIPKQRSYLSALIKSITYSRMGLFNCIIRV